MPTIKIADKPTLDAAKTVIDGVSDTLGSVADEVRELLERTPFDIDSYMYYFGGLRSTHPGDDVYNWLMRTVTIVDAPGVTELGSYALYNCKNLTSVSIPDATTIGDHALAGCDLLSTINAPRIISTGSTWLTSNTLQKLILPNVETFERLSSCPELKYVCCGIKAVTNIFTYIGLGKLKYVAFPRAETIVNYVQMSPRTAGVNYIFPSDTVCVATGSLSVSGFADAWVYVPAALYDNYINATNWSAIANRIRKIEDSQEILDALAEMGVDYA